MKRTLKCSAAGLAAIALAASTAKAQTLVYSFETLYDSNNVVDPAGTRPDDFYANGTGTTITQSTIGVTNGSYSMDFAQTSSAYFTGAISQLVPEVIDDPNTVAISVDVTIPSTGAFTGTFARMGISQFGNNESQGYEGAQVQTVASSEPNLDLGAGTYQFTIPLIAISNPLTGDSDVPFSSCFGSDPDTQLTPVSFEFYINKSTDQALNVYLDDVQAIGPATIGTWANSGGGSWSVLGNWTGGIPQLALDTANFNGAITHTSTVSLNGNRSVGTLNFDNSNQYVIAQGTGSGTLTLDAGGSNTSTINVSLGTHTISAPVDFNTNTTVTVNNAGNTLNISGNITGIGDLDVAGNGTVDLSGTNSYVGGTTVSSGVLVVGSATALPTSNAVVNIASGAKMKLATGIGGVTMQLPNITAGGIFDINNDHVFINYGATDPITTIVAWIDSGYAGGTWTGTGINSSAAAANSSSYGIGYADSADPGNPANLASGTIEIMYTLLGDANLDDKVNGTDFNLMATNFNQAVTDGWDKGDFNYDNKVNGNDFVLLAANFNQFASQSAVSAADLAALDSFAAANGISVTSVPEPMSAGMMVMAGLGILRRRRR